MRTKMDPSNPNTKLTSAWSFADKFYPRPNDQYRKNWDRIFLKKRPNTCEEKKQEEHIDQHQHRKGQT
jgi:hypothetical protein